MKKLENGNWTCEDCGAMYSGERHLTECIVCGRKVILKADQVRELVNHIKHLSGELAEASDKLQELLKEE